MFWRYSVGCEKKCHTLNFKMNNEEEEAMSEMNNSLEGLDFSGENSIIQDEAKIDINSDSDFGSSENEDPITQTLMAKLEDLSLDITEVMNPIETSDDGNLVLKEEEEEEEEEIPESFIEKNESDAFEEEIAALNQESEQFLNQLDNFKAGDTTNLFDSSFVDDKDSDNESTNELDYIFRDTKKHDKKFQERMDKIVPFEQIPPKDEYKVIVDEDDFLVSLDNMEAEALVVDSVSESDDDDIDINPRTMMDEVDRDTLKLEAFIDYCLKRPKRTI